VCGNGHWLLSRMAVFSKRTFLLRIKLHAQHNLFIVFRQLACSRINEVGGSAERTTSLKQGKKRLTTSFAPGSEFSYLGRKFLTWVGSFNTRVGINLTWAGSFNTWVGSFNTWWVLILPGSEVSYLGK
jgi:hypothetical protein